MIAGIFHAGSGLGNQLHRYVMTRVLALDKGYEWGMLQPEQFKGVSFMQLDMGSPLTVMPRSFFEQKIVDENGVDIRSYDPEVNFIEDGTLIDGEFQDERYFSHRLADIRKWLKVETLEVADDLCVMGFRGGEYALYPDLFLPKEYWESCIGIMRSQNSQMRFHVVTDDPSLARQFFPDFEITHEIGTDWKMIRYAKHSIISNSSFYIFPRLLNEKNGVTLAPRYWARHNTKTWALPQNYYSCFSYI